MDYSNPRGLFCHLSLGPCLRLHIVSITYYKISENHWIYWITGWTGRKTFTEAFTCYRAFKGGSLLGISSMGQSRSHKWDMFLLKSKSLPSPPSSSKVGSVRCSNLTFTLEGISQHVSYHWTLRNLTKIANLWNVAVLLTTGYFLFIRGNQLVIKVVHQCDVLHNVKVITLSVDGIMAESKNRLSSEARLWRCTAGPFR